MSNPYLGEIRMFGGNFAPRGWAFCNGQLLSIADYDTLFALIGTTYGGDGQNTFGLPNLQGRLPLHQGNLLGTAYPLAQSAGTETVTLSAGQIGPHTHAANAGGGATTGNPAGNLLGATSGNPRYLPPGSGQILSLNAQTVQPAGGNQPHENMMPYLAVSFIIALQGIFPSQN